MTLKKFMYHLHSMAQYILKFQPCRSKALAVVRGIRSKLATILYILVENARKFRESAPNQIPIFGKPPPRVGVSENIWFFKSKRVDRANVRRN